ncbi:hypothetical protein [Rathayibacter oskolensis]|uniref:hypothetical protein n=1 Tax=Rathayibacter oskolensis TaxID=1891671 RepID=UPI003F5D5070
MSIILGDHQYGKAENRVVRIYRDSPRREIHDVNVSTALRGDFDAAHLEGDQSAVLPTDTQKQTAYSFAKEKGLRSIEAYGLELARHFVDGYAPCTAPASRSRSSPGSACSSTARSTTTPGSGRARRCASPPSPSRARATSSACG